MALDRRLAVDLIVGCVAIGWAAIFFRLAGDESPLLASSLRLAIAAAVLAPWVIRAARAGKIGPRVRRAALMGGALYALHFGSWVASLQWTSVAASVTLVTATPLLLALVGLARRRDRPTRREGIAIGIATIGVVIIGAADASTSADALIGDALALLGAIGMALYLLVARELGDELDPVSFMGMSAGIGALVLAIAWLATAPLASLSASALPSMQALGWIAMSALIPQLVGHTLLTRALRRATPTVVGLATCSEPVLSTLLAIPILGERPEPVVLIGCAVTLAGVLGGVRATR
ncbi:MAG: DMT family transporter [Myxococcota bacterium]|nr:DMT family transporter [Myxococcota bacterium]